LCVPGLRLLRPWGLLLPLWLGALGRSAVCGCVGVTLWRTRCAWSAATGACRLLLCWLLRPWLRLRLLRPWLRPRLWLRLLRPWLRLRLWLGLRLCLRLWLSHPFVYVARACPVLGHIFSFTKCHACPLRAC
jgi:hypothetical protein